MQRHDSNCCLSWQEQARERDRQFAEKLARELNSAGAPGAAQGGSSAATGGSNPAQGFEMRAAASAQARLRAAFPDADADVLLSTLLVANSDFESACKVRFAAAACAVAVGAGVPACAFLVHSTCSEAGSDHANLPRCRWRDLSTSVAVGS